jgi:hypothetical protein
VRVVGAGSAGPDAPATGRGAARGVTALVFLLALPAIVVLVGTWAWRYQLRALALVRRPHRGGGEVALAAVSRAEPHVVRLVCESPTHRYETHLVALEPGPTLATLDAWARDHARLIARVEEACVELTRLDGPGTVTLERIR